MSWVGRGWGKVILCGEHAVVYGAPALVAALDVGVEVEARMSGTPSTVRVLDPPGRPATLPGDGTPLGEALAAALAAMPVAPPPLELLARSRVPVGVGLGSSAAFSVALARALAEACGLTLDAGALGGVASAAETVFHGRPSGIDVAAAALPDPGVLAFQRGAAAVPIALGAELTLVVAVVEAAPPTREMVERVGQWAERRPGAWRAFLSGASEIGAQAREALETGNWPRLGRLFDENHRLLHGLGVTTRALGEACAQARAAGALGAKLTGAGGGGAIIALAPTGAERVRAVLEERGARYTHVMRLLPTPPAARSEP